MQSTSSLISRLRNDFTQFTFIQGGDFHWSPTEMTIVYSPKGNPAFVFHELGHALLGHNGYTRDVQLLEMEREAWEYAVRLSATYSVHIDEDITEESLDTYRDWLHARSICPSCTSTGLQIKEKTYNCIVCFASWRVNEARLCGLKRRLIIAK